MRWRTLRFVRHRTDSGGALTGQYWRSLPSASRFPQEDHSCGPSALATSLGALGVAVTPEQLIGQVYLPGRKGSLQAEMLGAPRRYGMVSYELAPRFADVLREIAAGTPVIVLQDYGVWPVPIWHYAVAVGYDRGSGEIILRSGEKRRLVMPLGVLEYTWKETGYWSMVVMPPDRIPATATEEGYLAAVMALERVEPAAGGTAYAALLARWPDNLTAGIGRSNARYASGKLVEAEVVLRHVLERHPDSIAARNNLRRPCRIWAGMQRHWNRLSAPGRRTAPMLRHCMRRLRRLTLRSSSASIRYADPGPVPGFSRARPDEARLRSASFGCAEETRAIAEPTLP